MTDETLLWVAFSLAAVFLSWVLPRAQAKYGVAAATAVGLVLMSPYGALCLTVSTAATCTVVNIEQTRYKKLALLAVGVFSLMVFLFIREQSWVSMAGIAYFTLRNLSVLFDSWMNRHRRISWADVFIYQFFMPVIAVGPIHRLELFSREWRMRRFNVDEFATGSERALLGLFAAVVLGSWLGGKLESALGALLENSEAFYPMWVMSVFDWVQLYFVFAGFSAFAIGTALMMGVRLEENFNRPFTATNLMDFWTRWHISLSMWCRDYVYQPVVALSRNRLLALLAAMAVIGLWHETSWYYFLWALWQAFGIVLNRYFIHFGNQSVPALPAWFKSALGPVWVLAWVSLAQPVIRTLIG